MMRVRTTLGISCGRSLFLMHGSTVTYVMNRPSPEHREGKGTQAAALHITNPAWQRWRGEP